MRAALDMVLKILGESLPEEGRVGNYRQDCVTREIKTPRRSTFAKPDDFTIIDPGELNDRIRNGNGCDLSSMVTSKSVSARLTTMQSASSRPRELIPRQSGPGLPKDLIQRDAQFF